LSCCSGSVPAPLPSRALDSLSPPEAHLRTNAGIGEQCFADTDGGRGDGGSEKEMDIEWADADRKTFVRDIALCLSVSRGTSPALVWPDGGDALLGQFADLYDLGLYDGYDGADGLPPPTPADEQVPDIAAGLGELLGTRVDAFFQPVPVGVSGTLLGESDLILIPVRDGCHLHVEPSADSAGLAPAGHSISLRLRVGGAFYVPAGFTSTLSQAHIPCALLVLSVRTD
jgi:hypothetical protein